ncbi:MAG TPA: PTS sugar transporter subunit IIB [Candidatus Krumholzibacteria bacterium]|nr:PTS sugar transporter subunit IIB [Candidatus Krumholzibacteria bacterium]HPD71293.1 PTS sugar transporter subunit IIB [Candidatus Krumholzibacteria bacterium]HRY39007.1 PTS sugar transporter subunit IIB [Candidatus Krumholzibacteria bacterium]
MNLVLARIDDRFIHGQVTVGWGQRLQPDLILLANDEIAADPWQARVYAATVPPQVTVSVRGLGAAAAALRDPAAALPGHERAILLTGSPADMHALVAFGVALDRVNVGGMHFQAGKLEMLPGLYVDRDDLANFRTLLRRGVRLAVQAVPGGREVLVDDGLLAAVEARL